MIEDPMASAGRWLVEKTGLTAATVNKCLGPPERFGIVRDLIVQKRNRLISHAGYGAIMNQGTGLPGQSMAGRKGDRGKRS